MNASPSHSTPLVLQPGNIAIPLSAFRCPLSRVSLIPALFACICLLGSSGCRKSESASDQGGDQFTRLTNLGKSQLEAGDANKAVDYFTQALNLNPTVLEAQLNLANAHLRANHNDQAIQLAQKVVDTDHTSAAGYYVLGCAYLRLGKAEEALKALEQSQKLDEKVTALNFQLALAHEGLGHNEEAVRQLQFVTQYEPEHLAAHYRLSQLLLRLGNQTEADAELKKHQALLAKAPKTSADVGTFERCKHTQAKLPFKMEQPASTGVQVAFADMTAAALPDASRYGGPLATLDVAHDGTNSLFVREQDGFRLLQNRGGKFEAQSAPLPAITGANYRRALVGDLQSDRTEDVVLLSDKGNQVFTFTTNGVVADSSRAAAFSNVPAIDGLLLDFDYTGKLGMILLQPDGKGVRVFRNLSSPFAMYFSENNVTSGLPASLPGGQRLVLEDWNNDELMDIAVVRDNQQPIVFARERGGPFTATNLGAAFPVCTAMAAGDLNNDSIPDAVCAGAGQIDIVFGGGKPATHLPLGNQSSAAAIYLVDYDNDGWLDLFVAGEGLRAWRNLGNAGFRETTAELGLTQLPKGRITSLIAADLDGDCDIDLALTIEGAGMRVLRNDGASVNHLLKLRLVGNRSNPSALGVRYEVSAGGLRMWRTVRELPVEVGVGRYAQVDSVAVRWSDGFLNNDDLKTTPCQVSVLDELGRDTGSCPFLYAWNGRGFRFVTDLLGAAPLGLRVTDTHFVDADPAEYVRLGNELEFPPRDGQHVVQITEELREVLYLDEAKLVVVDHPPGTEVHTTGKLLPGKPFLPHELWTLHHRLPLRQAVTHEGVDVTSKLLEVDQKMVSPAKLRVRQLRGLAEPHAVTLDFGTLAVGRPLVLALTGWLQFGGGMANVGAAHTPDLPFPFPVLEAEIATNQWKPVPVTVGAPAGKTKTILVDLAGKLPEGTRRLRLSSAFEVHWDRIALFERRDNTETRITRVTPTKSDLHWRGYSEFELWPADLPRTPNYASVTSTAHWTITPQGWCTRYGAVDELIAGADNALALLNGGDELTLEFAAATLPPKPAGLTREFFLYTVGWDKDADFHCELGWQVEPLPWQGMDDQAYGHQERPVFANDNWIRKYNTRWVGPYTTVRRTDSSR
ncbi:MAG TPA: FG-GAP-like repeat-containing protein [Verrucomicrobiae bacterium]|nr:FG-GAP-like repeat-containing protein [Verrucomicrobiae bacterium]